MFKNAKLTLYSHFGSSLCKEYPAFCTKMEESFSLTPQLKAKYGLNFKHNLEKLIGVHTAP